MAICLLMSTVSGWPQRCRGAPLERGEEDSCAGTSSGRACGCQFVSFGVLIDHRRHDPRGVHQHQPGRGRRAISCVKGRGSEGSIPRRARRPSRKPNTTSRSSACWLATRRRLTTTNRMLQERPSGTSFWAVESAGPSIRLRVPTINTPRPSTSLWCPKSQNETPAGSSVDCGREAGGVEDGCPARRSAAWQRGCRIEDWRKGRGTTILTMLRLGIGKPWTGRRS